MLYLADMYAENCNKNTSKMFETIVKARPALAFADDFCIGHLSEIIIVWDPKQ